MMPMMCMVEERRPSLYHELISTSRIASIEKNFFRRGCGLTEDRIKEGLDNIAGIHRKKVEIMKLKHDVAEVLKMTAVVTMSDRVQAISDRVEDYLATNKVLAVAWWGSEGGFGGDYDHLHVNCPRAQSVSRRSAAVGLVGGGR